MQYRVVVCSCLDASILVGAQCTNSTLMALEEETMSAIHPCQKPRHVAQPHWTHLLIDEVCFYLFFFLWLGFEQISFIAKAAQGSEPELLIPISVVLPHPSRPQTSFMPQLTLCGDVNQCKLFHQGRYAIKGILNVTLAVGPLVASDEARAAEFEMSLLERLFERPLYSNFLLNPLNGHNGNLVSRLLPPYTHLIKVCYPIKIKCH